MTKTKSTKRALLMSGLALLMCVSMLIGSTFAWFTDSVTSGKNKIISGNLDLDVSYGTLNYENGDVSLTELKTLEGASDVFGEDALWEPGYQEVAIIAIANKGNLALKADMAISAIDVVGKTKDGKEIVLSDYIESVVQVGDKFDSMDEFEEYYGRYVQDLKDGIEYQLGDDVRDVFNGILDIQSYYVSWNNIKETDTSRMKDTVLEPGQVLPISVSLRMPTTVGNEANHNGKDVPSIDFGITVVATQATVESDSFDNQYDKDATYPEIIAAEDLAAELTPVDGVITIDKDYIVTGEWTSINVEGQNITIDGQGHTISNLNKPLVAGNVGESLTIKNLTIADSNIGPAANENGLGTGAFACFKDAYGSATFENCHLVNSTVTSNFCAGGLMGYNSGGELVITDCSVVNCEITGVSGAAGLVAFTQKNATITNSKVESTQITATENRLGTKAPVAGAIVGTANADAVVTLSSVESTGNTVSNNNATAVYSEKIGRLVGNATVVEN